MTNYSKKQSNNNSIVNSRIERCKRSSSKTNNKKSRKTSNSSIDSLNNNLNSKVSSRKINNEHDKTFRMILTSRKEAVKVINKVLELRNNNRLEPEDIELYETQYITNKYENRQSDVVYKVNRAKVEQGEVFIHIEHQTKVDPTMPYRMEEYEHEIKRIAMKDNKVGLIPKVYIYLCIVETQTGM